MGDVFPKTTQQVGFQVAFVGLTSAMADLQMNRPVKQALTVSFREIIPRISNASKID